MASTDRERKRERKGRRQRGRQSRRHRVSQVRTPTQLQLINFDALNLKGTTARDLPQKAATTATATHQRGESAHNLHARAKAKESNRQTHRQRERQRQGETETETGRQRHSQRQVWRLHCTNEMHNFVVNFWQFAYRKRTRALIAN